MKNTRKGSKSLSNNYLDTTDISSELKERSVKGGLLTLLSQVCKFSLSLVSNILLARLLTPEDYGLIGMVGSIVLFVGFFKDLGLSAATIQKKDIAQAQVSALFWINIALGIATTFISIAAAPLAVWFYKEPRLIPIIIISSASFLISSLSVQHSAILTRRMQFGKLVTIDLISNFSGLLSGIIFAVLGFGYWALVVLPIVGSLIYTFLSWILCRWRPNLPKRGSEVQSMLVFGGNLTGFNIINYFSRNLDNVLIGRVWGAQELGLYTKAYQLLLLPLNQINSPLSSVAIPTLSRLTDSPNQYKKTYLRIIEKALIVAVPLMVFMISSSDWLINILLGPQWIDSSKIFMLLGIAGILQPVANSTGWIFISQGLTGEMLRWGIISTIVTVISFVIGLPWGGVGVAAAYSIVWLLVTMPLLFWYVGRISPVKAKDFYLTAAPIAFSSLCAALPMILFRHLVQVSNPFIGCLVAATLISLFFFSILALIPRGKLMLQDFKSLIPMLKSKKVID